MAIIGSFGGEDAATLSATWSDLNVAYPPANANNEDRTVSWTVGGSRTIAANYSGSNGTLSYRINSGAWTSYTAGFSLSSGQTLAWRLVWSADEFGAFTVTENGRTLATIDYSATGIP
jgi:hypothetical protein